MFREYIEEKSFPIPDRLCFVPRILRMEGMVLGYIVITNDRRSSLGMCWMYV